MLSRCFRKEHRQETSWGHRLPRQRPHQLQRPQTAAVVGGRRSKLVTCLQLGCLPFLASGIYLSALRPCAIAW